MAKSKPDAGLWYYHAPEVQSGMPKVNYPPPSQIPGLNGVPVDQAAEEERERNAKFWFKDTDTAYVRLAKMGGRKDLLVIPDSKKAEEGGNYATPARSTHGQHANRCDWYYQLDNMADDAARAANEPKTVHKFQVPEYMMHHERKAQAPKNYGQSAAPFATYAKNVTDSIDGGDPTDKTRRIQEPLKQGFGRRLAKQKEMDKRTQHGYYPQPGNDEGNRAAIRSAPNDAHPPPRYEYSKPPQTEGEGSMTKLLSNGYQRDWVSEQNKWWNENEKRAIRFAEDNGMDPNAAPKTIMAGNPPNGPGVTGSEYSQQYAQYAQPQQRQHTASYPYAAQAGYGREAPYATQK